jgi:hypothetical protein
MGQTVREGDPLYEKLYTLWLEQGKPGWVVRSGGDQWKALQPGDDEVIFEKRGGFDDYYGSHSRGIS